MNLILLILIFSLVKSDDDEISSYRPKEASFDKSLCSNCIESIPDLVKSRIFRGLQVTSL